MGRGEEKSEEKKSERTSEKEPEMGEGLKLISAIKNQGSGREGFGMEIRKTWRGTSHSGGGFALTRPGEKLEKFKKEVVEGREEN